MKNSLYLLVFFISCFQFNLRAQEPIKLQNKDSIIKKTIIIYGSPDCHYCTIAKNSLIENKVDFIFYDIDTDKEALNEMLAKLRKANISVSNLGIPVIDKYGELFSNNTNFEDFLKRLKQ